MTDKSEVVERIIEQASNYLTDPPCDDDPVISLASPSELVETFSSSVGLGFANESSSSSDD